MRLLFVYPTNSPEIEALIEVLRARDCIVYIARDQNEADVFLVDYDFDIVVICDYGSTAPYRFVTAIRRKQNAAPLVILASPAADPASEIAMLDAGADDYVRRPVDPEAFTARLRAICRRQNGVTQKILKFGGFELDLKNEVLTYEGCNVRLTVTEFRMLSRICRKPGQVVTTEMLMNHMYDGRDDPTIDILKVMACKIRRKMSAATPDGGRWIETVWGRGYVLRKEPRKPADPLEMSALAQLMEKHV